MYDWGLVREERQIQGEAERGKERRAPLYASTRTGAPASACAQARGHGMHAHKCTCEPLGTQARPFKSLGTLPRKLLGTPICKPVSVTACFY